MLNFVNFMAKQLIYFILIHLKLFFVWKYELHNNQIFKWINKTKRLERHFSPLLCVEKSAFLIIKKIINKINIFLFSSIYQKMNIWIIKIIHRYMIIHTFFSLFCSKIKVNIYFIKINWFLWEYTKTKGSFNDAWMFEKKTWANFI